MYVCIAVSVCLCLPSKLRESGVVTIVAIFIIKTTIFSIMPLMMTLLRHFTQQLNQICLYGDTMSIGQGQPIPQTRRCRQKNVVFGCFSTSSLSLLPSLLAQGSLSREAPREQRRSWSKSSLLSPRVHLISSSSTFKLTSLRPTSSLALGSSLSARKLQSNHWKEKYWECNVWKKSDLFEYPSPSMISCFALLISLRISLRISCFTTWQW